MTATQIIVAAAGDVVTAATDTELIGQDLYEIEGVKEAFGPDFRHVAVVTREPLTVTRMWRGVVWSARIEPFGDDGIYIEAEELARVGDGDFLTVTRFADAVDRIYGALTSDCEGCNDAG